MREGERLWHRLYPMTDPQGSCSPLCVDSVTAHMDPWKIGCAFLPIVLTPINCGLATNRLFRLEYLTLKWISQVQGASQRVPPVGYRSPRTGFINSALIARALKMSGNGRDNMTLWKGIGSPRRLIMGQASRFVEVWRCATFLQFELWEVLFE